jgi:hypothetical protein
VSHARATSECWEFADTYKGYVVSRLDSSRLGNLCSAHSGQRGSSADAYTDAATPSSL